MIELIKMWEFDWPSSLSGFQRSPAPSRPVVPWLSWPHCWRGFQLPEENGGRRCGLFRTHHPEDFPQEHGHWLQDAGESDQTVGTKLFKFFFMSEAVEDKHETLTRLCLCAGSSEELQWPVHQTAADQQLRHADKPSKDGWALPLLQSAAPQPAAETKESRGAEAGEESQPGASACGRLQPAQLLLRHGGVRTLQEDCVHRTILFLQLKWGLCLQKDARGTDSYWQRRRRNGEIWRIFLERTKKTSPLGRPEKLLSSHTNKNKTVFKLVVLKWDPQFLLVMNFLKAAERLRWAE